MSSSEQTEWFASEKIRQAFEACFPDVRIFRNLVIPLPLSERNPTAEIDCLVVCNAGAFMFEIKNWNNTLVTREHVQRGMKQWVLNNSGNMKIKVSDPILQGSEKKYELRRHIDPKIALRSYALIVGRCVQISPDMSSCVLTLTDLPYMVRVIKSEIKHSRTNVILNHECVDILSEIIFDLSKDMSIAEHVQFIIDAKNANIASKEFTNPLTNETLSNDKAID